MSANNTGQGKLTPLVVPDVTGMTQKEAAHAYLDAGLMPHPWRVSKGTKVSAYSGFRFEEIRETHESIDQWRRNWQCGLVVSKASGLIAGDIDDRAEFESWETDIDFPETAWAHTGREDGYHLLFDARELADEDWPTQGNIPGGQVKSNGFIAVEPSVHPNGTPYRWGRVRKVAPIGETGRGLCEYRASLNGYDPDGSGSPDTLSELEQRCLDAKNTEQHDALRDLITGLSREHSDDGYIVYRVMKIVGQMPVYKRGKPYTEADVRGLLYDEARRPVANDSVPGELDGTWSAEMAQGSPKPGSALGRRVAQLRIDQDARAILAAEGWRPPVPGISLAEARRNPPAPPRQIIKGMFPKGVSDIAGQFKTGKTTLGLNIADALGSGDNCLGAYPVDFPDGSVWYWNLELDEAQFFDWINRIVRSKTAAERIIAEHLRGVNADLTVPAVEEWATESLIRNQAKAWIIDPKGRLLRSENDNSEYNAWFRVTERIARNAELDLVLFFTHTGHASAGQENALPRARGASAQAGNTDANLSYRHGGDLGSYPPDDKRYLSGFGRGVDLAEVTLGYDATCGRLSVLEDAPGRKADKEERSVALAVDALVLSEASYLNSTALQKAIGGTPARACAAIAAAVKAKKLNRKEVGREVRYSLPPATKVRVS